MITEPSHADAAYGNTDRACSRSAHAQWIWKHWEQNLEAIQFCLAAPTSGLEGSPGKPDSGPVVLVVDDEPAIAITLSQIFIRHGFASVWLTDPHCAVSLLDKLPLRLIVTDLDMPDMDGVELALLARHKHPNCPVLLFTARGTDPQIMERLSDCNGAVHIQSKPVAVDALLARVRTLSGSPRAL